MYYWGGGGGKGYVGPPPPLKLLGGGLPPPPPPPPPCPPFAIASKSSPTCLSDIIEMSFCQCTKHTVGNFMVGMVTYLRRHFTYNSRVAWHTVYAVYAMLPANFKLDATCVSEMYTIEKCDFLKPQSPYSSRVLCNQKHVFKDLFRTADFLYLLSPDIS